MDYALPDHALDPHELKSRDLLAARVRNIGEPFQLFFTPEEMATELTNFRVIEDLDAKSINARYFAERTDQLRLYGKSGRIVSAWR
jgi:hypothetical protein